MSETELVQRVTPDPGLKGKEKETTITMYGDDKRFTIYSAKPTIVKSLLKHDHFDMNWARLMNGDDSVRITSENKLEETEGNIVAIEGTLPIGTLTVKSKPRVNDHQSSIISTETVDPSVFESS